jgi:signal transduction histidine kinase/CheY-like chemotaxis protein
MTQKRRAALRRVHGARLEPGLTSHPRTATLHAEWGRTRARCPGLKTNMAEASDNPTISLAYQTPTSAQRRSALVAVVLQFVACAVVAPFPAQVPRIDSFVPVILAIIFIADFITAVLLFSQFVTIASRAILILANGYLFSALIVIPHALTFPGAFAPKGLLGAGLQSSAWLNVFWHVGFLVAVAGYACLKRREHRRDTVSTSALPAFFWSLATQVSLVCALTWTVTAGDRFMPRFFLDDLSYTPLLQYAAGTLVLISVLVLVLMWTHRTSVLDLWISVAICMLISEMALVTSGLTARFYLGWYVSRTLAVAFSTAVLIALLYEITSLYTRLQDAMLVAKQADREKSSFLSAASHDLRQPLQTLSLLQRSLKPHIHGTEAGAILADISRSIGTMSSMLNSLLDITRLESGIVRPSISAFPVNALLDNVAADFLELAKEKGLELRVVPSSLMVRSDQRMLEEMVRNLISNAIRYTDRGKVLVGCRRAADKVRLEVWDSGVGISGQHIAHVFEEYYQVPQAVSLGGVGLGLAIVQRLGKLLGHQLVVRSVPGKGSGFSIEVPVTHESLVANHASKALPDIADTQFTGTILLIEDEGDMRRALDRLLRAKGLSVLSAASANEALTLVTEKGMRPDLVISDYNLPGKTNGVEIIEAVRGALAWKVPAIVLTGDIRPHVTGSIATHDLSVVTKPVAADELLGLINRRARSSAQTAAS